MSSNLAYKIKRLAHSQSLSIMALEKKSGLKNGSIRNIVSGHSKKPSAEHLLAICKVLGCSIGELLDEDLALKNQEKPFPDIIFQQKDLLHQTINHVLNFMKKNNITIKNKELYEAVEKIYLYIERKNNNEFDSEFADWYLEDRF